MSNAVVTQADIARARLPASYEAAKVAIQRCVEVDEVATLADNAVMLATYARLAEDDELFRTAQRLQDHAARRMGELIKLIPIAPGRPKNSGRASPELSPRKRAADAAGLSGHQVKTAVRVANVPKDAFEQQVEAANPPTVNELALQGMQHRPSQPRHVDLLADAHTALNDVVVAMRQMTHSQRELFRRAAQTRMSDANLDE